MLTKNQEKLSQKWKQEFYQKANLCFGRIFPQSTITFNLKSELYCGLAYFKTNKIEINEQLWGLGWRIVRQIIGHEIAHQIVYRWFGDVRGHEKEWKSVMALFGISIYQEVELKPVRNLKRETWYCQCRIYRITPRKASKIRSGELL
jgi:SprT protein